METLGDNRTVLAGIAVAVVAVGAVAYWRLNQSTSSATKKSNVGLNLINAARTGDVNSLRALVQGLNGPLDGVRDGEENTALLVAAEAGQEATAKLLLQLGSHVACKNFRDWGVLHHATYCPTTTKEFVQLFIDNGADVHASSNDGWTPLHIAASKNNIPIVSLLLSKGANVNAQTSLGQTALFIASNNGYTNLVTLLLQNKADGLIRTSKSLETCLHVAVWNKRIEVIKILLKAFPELIKYPMTDGTVPVHVAVASLNIDLVKLLLPYGADPKATKRDGTGCAHVAIHQGDSKECLEMLDYLITQCGCPLIGADKYGCTPLHHACRKEQKDLLLLLLKHKSPLNIRDHDGLTPLHSLCSTWKETIVGDEGKKLVELYKILREYDADLYIGDNNGSLPIHYAVCRAHNIELVKALLEDDPLLAFQKDKTERTPLHLVRTMYKNEVMRNLLENHMKKIRPEFFETFDPKHRIDVQHSRIPTSLSEAEQAQVLDNSVSIKTIAKYLKEGRYKKIVVLTGAGISTSCGIADFRSPGKGIYADPELKKRLGVESVADTFTLSTFANDPYAFYGIMKHLFLPVFQGKFVPSVAHKFIAKLHEKQLLSRNFTQNIDSLEVVAGLPHDKVVEAHGSVKSATCSKCLKKCADMDKFWEEVGADAVPTCDCGGILQPDVVLFGQGLPPSFYDHMADVDNCDLLIVMGTSLKVYPFAGLVNTVPDSTPRLLFNNEAVGAFERGVQEKLHEDGSDIELIKAGEEGTYRDVAILGDIDRAVLFFAKLCDLEM